MANPSVLWINGTFYTAKEVIRNGSMLVDPNGKIERIGTTELAAPDQWDQKEPVEVRDLQGRTVIPGFIDVHLHGGDGHEVMRGTYGDLEGISRFHAKHGTTSFLATTACASREDIVQALECAADSFKRGLTGAELLGVHLEGPFINIKRRGAMEVQHIRLPQIEELEQYVRSANNLIRLVTMAPEIEGGAEAVRWLTELGITVSIGHSDATYEQVVEAVQLGASHTTHHFNGMSPLHHREPGVAGAGLVLSQLTTELIADGFHVHPAVIKLLFDTKGEWNVCMITDAVAQAGLPDDEYDTVTVNGGVIYLKGTTTLAGSTLTMIQALKNVMNFTGYPLEKILPSLTAVPARQSGMAHRKGTLETGKDADFLIVDQELNIYSTYVKGKEVFTSAAI